MVPYKMVNIVMKGLVLAAFCSVSLQTGRAQEMLKVSEVNKSEYAPGYPNYTTQATDQLKSYPLPRYPRNNKLHRNFPWMDIRYLSRELPGPGGLGFGELKPARSVELTDELVRNWNYYIDLPTLRIDSNTAMNTYRNPSSMEYALINYANQHPEFPVSTITYHPQIDARLIGFDERIYIYSQDQPDKYYLTDKNNRPVIFNNRKWYSPLAPLDYVQKDALTSRMYVRQLTKFLKRPIDFINENDETYGHMRPDSVLRKDPEVAKLMNRMGWDYMKLNGWYQNRLDSTYKNTILAEPALRKAKFSFYNVTSVQYTYWSDYGMRRTTNSWFNGQHYSTPSFYPNYPMNWERANGPLNGYGIIADGRNRELAYGDKFFSPFISAGYKFEEQNIRPAQWLALLKSLTMLGADFFYVGYFNVTGGGKWPNGYGPFDPRGYIYQAAIPSYAQAVASRFTDFIENGTLLNVRSMPTEYMYRFRFYNNRSDKSQLILVRKAGNRYLLYGSVQPVTNKLNAVPEKQQVSIAVEDKNISFEIRKQGSMYILDLSNPANPVFYQLDGWHEASHPAYWSKNIELEGELPDNASAGKWPLLTEKTGKGLDFTSFTTAVVLNAGSTAAEYDFSPRKNSPMYCFIRVKNAGPKAGKLLVRYGAASATMMIAGNNWNYIRVEAGSGKPLALRTVANQRNTIRIQGTSGSVLVDKVILTEDPGWK